MPFVCLRLAAPPLSSCCFAPRACRRFTRGRRAQQVAWVGRELGGAVFYTAREFWPVRRRFGGGSAAMEIFRDARTGRVEPQGESNGQRWSGCVGQTCGRPMPLVRPPCALPQVEQYEPGGGRVNPLRLRDRVGRPWRPHEAAMRWMWIYGVCGEALRVRACPLTPREGAHAGSHAVSAGHETGANAAYR